jgi:hypothetical protein
MVLSLASLPHQAGAEPASQLSDIEPMEGLRGKDYGKTRMR